VIRPQEHLTHAYSKIAEKDNCHCLARKAADVEHTRKDHLEEGAPGKPVHYLGNRSLMTGKPKPARCDQFVPLFWLVVDKM
jgi:hypothetical protein